MKKSNIRRWADNGEANNSVSYVDITEIFLLEGSKGNNLMDKTNTQKVNAKYKVLNHWKHLKKVDFSKNSCDCSLPLARGMPNYLYVFTNHSEIIFIFITEEPAFYKEFVYKSSKSQTNVFNHNFFYIQQK